MIWALYSTSSSPSETTEDSSKAFGVCRGGVVLAGWLPFPSASEDSHIVSHQVVCLYIGSFDLTWQPCISIISNPYTVKMLIEREKMSLPEENSLLQSPLFICAVGLLTVLSQMEQGKGAGSLILFLRRSPVISIKGYISHVKKRL